MSMEVSDAIVSHHAMTDVAVVRHLCHLQFIDWPSEECLTYQHIRKQSSLSLKNLFT